MVLNYIILFLISVYGKFENTNLDVFKRCWGSDKWFKFANSSFRCEDKHNALLYYYYYLLVKFLCMKFRWQAWVCFNSNNTLWPLGLIYLLVIQLVSGTSKMCQLILCQNDQLQYLLLTMIIWLPFHKNLETQPSSWSTQTI